MLNDINTSNNIVEPLETTVKQICNNIRNLYATKLNCYCPQATDECGNVVWTITCNGNEIMDGKRYLHDSICGCLTVEDALQGIYDAGTSGMATEIRTKDIDGYCIVPYEGYNIAVVEGTSDNYNCVKTMPLVTLVPVFEGPDVMSAQLRVPEICASCCVDTGCLKTDEVVSDYIHNCTNEGYASFGTTNVYELCSSNGIMVTGGSLDMCGNPVTHLNDLCSSTSIINFKDGNGCLLGNIDGCHICFDCSTFGNSTITCANITNLTATNFNIPWASMCCNAMLAYDTDDTLCLGKTITNPGCCSIYIGQNINGCGMSNGLVVGNGGLFDKCYQFTNGWVRVRKTEQIGSINKWSVQSCGCVSGADVFNSVMNAGIIPAGGQVGCTRTWNAPGRYYETNPNFVYGAASIYVQYKLNSDDNNVLTFVASTGACMQFAKCNTTAACCEFCHTFFIYDV